MLADCQLACAITINIHCAHISIINFGLFWLDLWSEQDGNLVHAEALSLNSDTGVRLRLLDK